MFDFLCVLRLCPFFFRCANITPWPTIALCFVTWTAIFVAGIQEVVVGDIALLEPGEIIPCDGVFLRGHNVKCDESVATGETDTIKKLPFSECLTALERDGKEMEHVDCFLVSGSKVLEGVGSYVVVAVGTRSYNGRIMMGASSSPP